jgi:hypothetical protein
VKQSENESTQTITGFPVPAGDVGTRSRADRLANLGSERRWSTPALQRTTDLRPGSAVLRLTSEERPLTLVIIRPQRGSQPRA